jgi:hypothetical protein
MILVLQAAYAARAWQEHTQQKFVCLVSFVFFSSFIPTDPRFLNLLANPHLAAQSPAVIVS